jgi:heme oxygenase
MRVPDLERDLSHYGVDRSRLSPKPATVRFTRSIERFEDKEPVALLGSLYVVEGSTNGGRFLARVLRQAWQVDGQGLAYFDPYGDEQPARWASFKRDMDDAGFGDHERDAIVEAAKTTFEAIAEISDEVAREAELV